MPKQRKPRVQRAKKPSVFKLKRKLWSLFSVFVRLRDADKSGNVKCCTCDRVYYWTDPKGRMQAGHFFPQKGNAALIFDEKNVHGQCSLCNGAGSGEQYLYSLFIIKKYGKKELQSLLSRKGQAFKFTVEWLQEKIIHYTEEIKKLKEKKNL